jgi:hypothetical protein
MADWTTAARCRQRKVVWITGNSSGISCVTLAQAGHPVRLACERERTAFLMAPHLKPWTAPERCQGFLVSGRQRRFNERATLKLPNSKTFVDGWATAALRRSGAAMLDDHHWNSSGIIWVALAQVGLCLLACAKNEHARMSLPRVRLDSEALALDGRCRGFFCSGKG